MTRNDDVFRAVAVVAACSISHGEELYTDYLTDARMDESNVDHTPDWLLEPPPVNKYLQKKEFVSKVPFMVKVLHANEIA